MLMIEIESILRNGLEKIIKERGLEKLAFQLFDTLRILVDRADLETFRVFRTIAIEEGKEFEETFADASKEDQLAAQEVSKSFFEVCFKDL